MSLSMNTLAAGKGTKKPKRRLGRGQSSGRGKTAGRGTKGQRARSGGKSKLALRGMRQNILSFPKSRGFQSLEGSAATVRLEALDVFGVGSTINMKSLRQKGLIKRSDRKAKIVGTFELKKKLIIDGIQLSKTVEQIILKAGGEIKKVKNKKPSRDKKAAARKTAKHS